MYTPSGSTVLVRTAETQPSGQHEVKYLMLPADLPMFGNIQLIYYKKLLRYLITARIRGC